MLLVLMWRFVSRYRAHWSLDLNSAVVSEVLALRLTRVLLDILNARNDSLSVRPFLCSCNTTPCGQPAVPTDQHERHSGRDLLFLPRTEPFFRVRQAHSPAP